MITNLQFGTKIFKSSPLPDKNGKVLKCAKQRNTPDEISDAEVKKKNRLKKIPTYLLQVPKGLPALLKEKGATHKHDNPFFKYLRELFRLARNCINIDLRKKGASTRLEYIYLYVRESKWWKHRNNFDWLWHSGSVQGFVRLKKIFHGKALSEQDHPTLGYPDQITPTPPHLLFLYRQIIQILPVHI